MQSENVLDLQLQESVPRRKGPASRSKVVGSKSTDHVLDVYRVEHLFQPVKARREVIHRWTKAESYE